MENEISCSACQNIYEEAFVLPCLHCICQLCFIQNELDNQESGISKKIQCSTCEKEIFLASAVLPRYKIIETVIKEINMRSNKESVNLLCDFCQEDDDQPQREASLKCVECTYHYCKQCFKTAHINKGPLSRHHFVSPSIHQVGQDNYDECQIHLSEIKKLFCLDCNLCICFLCKEIGDHVGHSTKMLTNAIVTSKDNLQKKVENLKDLNIGIFTQIEKCEQRSLYIKRTGSKIEDYVIKDIDSMIRTLEEKKENFLKEISARYEDAMERINADISKLHNDLESVKALSEIAEKAEKSDDVIGVLESISPLIKRLSIIQEECERDIEDSTKVSLTMEPFSSMRLDTNHAKESVVKLTWIKQPEQVQFDKAKCYTVNNMIYLSWNPASSDIDSYYLMKKNRRGNYDLVYRGTQHENVEMIESYNEKCYYRVYSTNSIGNSEMSEKIKLKTAKGFQFKLDSKNTDPNIKLSEELLHMRTSSVGDVRSKAEEIAYFDKSLESGVHMWKAKYVHLSPSSNSKHSMLTFGLHYKDDDRNELKYKCSFYLNKRPKKPSTEFSLNLYKPAEELQHQDITFLLDLDHYYFNVYVSGTLVTPTITNHNGGNSFVNLQSGGAYTPFVGMLHLTAEITLVNDLRPPLSPPDKPSFLEESCYTKNTHAFFKWKSNDTEADAYLLELYFCLDKPALTIYRGNQNFASFDVRKYNQNVFARLYCINIAGVSESSDLLGLKTSKGLQFEFEESSSHNRHIELQQEGRSVKYINYGEPVLLFGNFQLKQDVHFWRMEIKEMNKDSFIVFGISTENERAESYGKKEHSSYGMKIMHCRSEQQNQLKCIPHDSIIPNFVQTEEEALNRHYAFLVDMEKRLFKCYVDGILQNHTQESISFKNKFQSTFSNIPNNLYPTVLMQGIVKISIMCNQETPALKPGAPVFSQSYCTNNTCFYRWLPGQQQSNNCSLIDYYTLKVKMTPDNNPTGENKNNGNQFRDVYKGNLGSFALKDVPCDSRIVAVVTATNHAGESEKSKNVTLIPAKRFHFEFYKPPNKWLFQLTNDNRTVTLISTIHCYVLGNRVIKDGYHRWRVCLDEFADKKQMTIVGVGITKYNLSDPVLGEDMFSYAVQIIECSKIQIRHTQHRYQLKQSAHHAKGAYIDIELNLTEHWMNVYHNRQQLVQDGDSGSILGHRPTFTEVHGEYYPAVSLYGTDVKVSIVDIN